MWVWSAVSTSSLLALPIPICPPSVLKMPWPSRLTSPPTKAKVFLVALCKPVAYAPIKGKIPDVTQLRLVLVMNLIRSVPAKPIGTPDGLVEVWIGEH